MGRPSYKDQLENMSETALCRILEEDYGMTVDNTITAEKMRETIIELKEKERQKSKTTTAKAASFFEGEPIVRVLFQHKDGDKELKFNYDGGKGVPADGKRWKVNLPFFFLLDGETYDLPLCVVEFLNSREVPDVRPVSGPNGQITNERYMRKRFSCEIKLSDEQKRNMRQKAQLQVA